MLGQIGLPGGGFGFGYGNSAGIGTGRCRSRPRPSAGANPRSCDPVARIADMLLDPGGEYDFNGSADVPGHPAGVLGRRQPVPPPPGPEPADRGVARPETIIVHEPWWTATARHADIVLPATTTLERNDIAAASRDRFGRDATGDRAGRRGARATSRSSPASPERLGCGEAFTGGRDEMSGSAPL